MLLLLLGIAAGQTSGPLPDLRCELRASDHVGMWFSPDGRSHLHFLLFSNRDGIQVYQDWNSWGYFARSFTAKDENSNIRNHPLDIGMDQELPIDRHFEQRRSFDHRYLFVRWDVACVAETAETEDG
jgi:hypothetical protein